jgi:hypothetical protein
MADKNVDHAPKRSNLRQRKAEKEEQAKEEARRRVQEAIEERQRIEHEANEELNVPDKKLVLVCRTQEDIEQYPYPPYWEEKWVPILTPHEPRSFLERASKRASVLLDWLGRVRKRIGW